MKRLLTTVAIGALLLVTGFVAGRLFQSANSGYYFEIRDSKDYDSVLGNFHWSYVTESFGLPVLDPGTTIIDFEGRTLYKAKRVFQENAPYAQNIAISETGIEWDDGDFSFNLIIEKLPEGEQEEVDQIVVAPESKPERKEKSKP